MVIKYGAGRKKNEIQTEQTTAVLQDLVNLREEHPQHEILLNFLQFQFASKLATVVGTRKLFTELFQWVTNALGDNLSFSVAKEVKPGLLADFLESHHPYIKAFF